jgi:predicted O-methyltransferase YrrM
VFDLVTKCFYDKTDYSEYLILKQYRNSLLQNKNTIEVTDFGVGSRVFKSNTRAINQIVKNAGISCKRAELLFRLVRYFQPSTILEIGASLGLATSALSLGNPKAKITTLEGCPSTLNQCQLQLQKFNINNVDCINAEFSTYLKTLDSRLSTFDFRLSPFDFRLSTFDFRLSPFDFRLSTFDFRLSTFDLIYFDGNHSKKATLEYFELLLPTINNDSVWIFDDIHWSKDMEEAWEIIKNHSKVTVSIDTFQWGIVFFRSEQKKEHFTIRV